jgi:chromosome segregation ATPase
MDLKSSKALQVALLAGATLPPLLASQLPEQAKSVPLGAVSNSLLEFDEAIAEKDSSPSSALQKLELRVKRLAIECEALQVTREQILLNSRTQLQEAQVFAIKNSLSVSVTKENIRFAKQTITENAEKINDISDAINSLNTRHKKLVKALDKAEEKLDAAKGKVSDQITTREGYEDTIDDLREVTIPGLEKEIKQLEDDCSHLERKLNPKKGRGFNPLNPGSW